MRWVEQVQITELPVGNPKLSTYLGLLADRIRENSRFYSEMLGYSERRSDCSAFVRYFLSRVGGRPPHSITILKGNVGIGKSNFIRWLVGTFQIARVSSVIDVNDSILPDNEATTIADYVYMKSVSHLEPLLGQPRVRDKFDLLARQVAKATRASDQEAFIQGFLSQSKSFREAFPLIGPPVLLCTLVSALGSVYRKPVWIFIDNVDLENKPVQDHFIRTAFALHNDLVDQSARRGWHCRFHVVLTIRPETALRWPGHCHDYPETSYPIPDVLSILEKRITDAMASMASSLDQLFPLSLGSRTIRSLGELNDLVLAHTRLRRDSVGGIGENWCMRLVNHNVRRFVNSWAFIINSNNFGDYIASDASDDVSQDQDRFLRFLIKGSYNYFRGNAHIQGEKPGSPLFLNVFDVENGVDRSRLIRNYLVFVRILEYLKVNQVNPNDTVPLSVLTQDLLGFHDIEAIEYALKMLLWTRVVSESECGIRDTFGDESYQEIDLASLGTKARLVFTETSSLYIDSLLRNYEYLSAMALVSYQLPNEHNSDRANMGSDSSSVLRYATCLLAFLTSWKDILVRNLVSYRKNGKLGSFLRVFKLPDDRLRTWNRAVMASVAKLSSRQLYDVRIHKVIYQLECLEAVGGRNIDEGYNL